MIKIPNLDDQKYDDIVETARRKVMQIFPDWSNFNPSDPGLTILELFAWLKEMQQYHLNHISHIGVLSCLLLLGITPLKAAAAKVIAVFSKTQPPQESPYTIAIGFPFAAEGGLVYETLSEVTIGDASIVSVWIDSGNGPAELSERAHTQGLLIEPFGPNESEDACLYIGFDKPTLPELKLYFDIFDEYPVLRSPFGDELMPSRDISWEYGSDFDAASETVDMTRGFSVSGEVRITLGGEWEASIPAQGMRKCYWLRARLIGRGVEEIPKIKRITNNFAALTQCETLSIDADLPTRSGTLTLRDYLGTFGEHIVFASEPRGWIRLPAPQKRRFGDRTEIETGNDAANYRVVSIKADFSAIMSTETDLPGIRLRIPAQGYFEHIKLMIEDSGIWQDWALIEHLHTAGPHDRVFSLDSEDSSVVFGDNVHGACPPAGNDNVLISACRVTRGAEGNILQHKLSVVGSGADVPLPDNITAGEGGRDPETLSQTLARVAVVLSERDRCVTREDYERIAAATPGTRILKTRAIEGYDAITRETGNPTLVTVVVQPFSASEHPKPDERLRSRVKRHLDKGRLLTTRIEVVAPEYIPIAVKIDAVVSDSDAARKSIKENLLRFLSPTEGALGIGDTVPVTEIIALAGRSTCVLRVLGVALSAPENAATIDRSGNVELPLHAIAYAHEIDINTTS